MPSGPFEPGECPGQVALAEGQQTDPVIGTHEARGVCHRLGNLEPFFCEGPALSEHARAQHGTRRARARELTAGRATLPEALVAPLPVQGLYSLPEIVDRLTIVALAEVGSAEVVVRQRVQDDIPAGRGERQGALGGGNGLVIRAHVVEMGLPESAETCPSRRGSSRAVARASASRRTARMRPKSPDRMERRAQSEP